MKLNKQQEMLSNINACAEMAISISNTVEEELSTVSFRVTLSGQRYWIEKKYGNEPRWGIFELLKGKVTVFTHGYLSTVDFYIYKKEFAEKLALEY